MQPLFLCLNIGSSSLKFALFTATTPRTCTLLSRGIYDLNNGFTKATLKDTVGDLKAEETFSEPLNLNKLLAHLLQWMKKHFPTYGLQAAGHRIVHGGKFYQDSLLLRETDLKNLETLIPLAPLHQPYNLQGIHILKELYPTLPQIGCFDTAFHHTQPRLAQLFALPHNLLEEGIYRYGFHGLSYAYIAQKLPEFLGEKAKGKVIVAHLGQGASLCGLQNQQSQATTMGFTTLDGLPMGTRCGTLDPGVILYLLQEKKMRLQDIEDLLYHRSGLLGLSGVSSDMRELLSSSSPQAQEAISFFIYRVSREIASLVGDLKGIDALVFTGGIGENASLIRQKICEEIQWLGVKINPELNAQHKQKEAGTLHHEESPVSLWVIPTDEEQLIAQEILKCVK